MRPFKLISWMIKRIVRLSFDPAKVGQFISLFDENKKMIRSFPGCRYLELLKEQNTNNIYFTISIWESGVVLENYRTSELFETTWRKTKKLFNDKPLAWSLEIQDKVEYEE